MSVCSLEPLPHGSWERRLRKYNLSDCAFVLFLSFTADCSERDRIRMSVASKNSPSTEKGLPLPLEDGKPQGISHKVNARCLVTHHCPWYYLLLCLELFLLGLAQTQAGHRDPTAYINPCQLHGCLPGIGPSSLLGRTQLLFSCNHANNVVLDQESSGLLSSQTGKVQRMCLSLQVGHLPR